MLVRVVVVVVVVVDVVVLVIAEVATNKGKVKFHCGLITERKRSKLASEQLQAKGGRQLLGGVHRGGWGGGSEKIQLLIFMHKALVNKFN